MSCRVGEGKGGNGGAVVVAERMNEDPKKGREDWADDAAGRQCELEEVILVNDQVYVVPMVVRCTIHWICPLAGRPIRNRYSSGRCLVRCVRLREGRRPRSHEVDRCKTDEEEWHC